MSCMDELKKYGGYCEQYTVCKWHYVLKDDFYDFEIREFLYANTSYAESTLKTYYYTRPKGDFYHVSDDEHKEMAECVRKFQKKQTEERLAWEKRCKAEKEARREKRYNSEIFEDDEDEFMQYVSDSPCVYVLECCDKHYKPIGVKVGSATDFRARIKTIKDDIRSTSKGKSAKKAGIKYYRPLAYFPTIGENKDISRAYAYKLESSLHIFMERFKNFKRVGNDHFIFTDDDEHFRLYELLEDEETIKDLYAMVEDFNDNFSLQQSILETYTKFRYL